MLLAPRSVTRLLCASTAFFLAFGDVAAALAQSEPLPANPCAVQPQPRMKKPEDPPVPPSVGRDKVDRLLRERKRPDDPVMQDPSMQPPPQIRAPQDDDAIRRLGQQLRRQPGPPPPAVAVVPPGAPEPG